MRRGCSGPKLEQAESKNLTNVKRKTQQLGGSWARKPPWPGAGMSGSEPSLSNITMLLYKYLLQLQMPRSGSGVVDPS